MKKTDCKKPLISFRQSFLSLTAFLILQLDNKTIDKAISELEYSWIKILLISWTTFKLVRIFNRMSFCFRFADDHVHSTSSLLYLFRSLNWRFLNFVDF